MTIKHEPRTPLYNIDDALSSHLAFINSEHSTNIDMYCAHIIEALLSATDGIVPKTSSDFFKHWWDDELNNLQQKSVDAYDVYCNTQAHVHYDISVEMVALCVSKLKLGKASGN